MAITVEQIREVFDRTEQIVTGWQTRATEAERSSLRLAEYVLEMQAAGVEVPFAVETTARMVVERERARYAEGLPV
jgi:hypothetical protein